MTRARDLANLGDNAATLEKQGLTLINTTTVTTSGSFSLSANTFSSTYTNYRIIGRFAPSTSAYITFRLRTGSTDAETNYVYQYTRSNAQGVSANAGTLTEGYFTMQTYSTAAVFSFDIFSPNVATPTIFLGNDSEISTTTVTLHNTYTYHNTSTAYDSITIIPSTGTVTGTVQVYGYNK
jgi:hypothetical protein